jgi:hypothetical protein
MHFQSVLGAQLGKFFLAELDYQSRNLLGIHIRDSTDREFTSNASRNDSLITRVIKGTFNTVQGKRRVSPTALQSLANTLMDIDSVTNRVMKFFHLESQVIISLFFLGYYLKYLFKEEFL